MLYIVISRESYLYVYFTEKKCVSVCIYIYNVTFWYVLESNYLLHTLLYVSSLHRQVEGYFRIKGSTEFCIERAIAFAPYAEPGQSSVDFPG